MLIKKIISKIIQHHNIHHALIIPHFCPQVNGFIVCRRRLPSDKHPVFLTQVNYILTKLLFQLI